MDFENYKGIHIFRKIQHEKAMNQLNYNEIDYYD